MMPTRMKTQTTLIKNPLRPQHTAEKCTGVTPIENTVELPGVAPPENPVKLPGVAPKENELDDDVVTTLMSSNYGSGNDFDDRD